MFQPANLDLEKNDLNLNLPCEFGRAQKNRKVLENLEKIKRKAKAKAKVGVKDIRWILSSLNSSSKKERDLDREYEQKMGFKSKRQIEVFQTPSRICKQIKEDKENLRLYEEMAENETEEDKLERLKRIDDFIQSNQQLVEEDLHKIKNYAQNEKEPLTLQEIKSIEATSSIIERYLSSEINNYGPDYFQKENGFTKTRIF
jgi:hypothetical protein